MFAQFFADNTLPHMRFFQPYNIFFDYMWANFGIFGKHVYDVGAGCGHVAKTLHNREFKVTAIDLIPRENPAYDVTITDGSVYPYSRDGVVLLARPCHGVFPERILVRAVECDVHSIVYAGLPKNVNQDLGKYRRKFKCVWRNVGHDRESLYIWRRHVA